MDQLYKEAFGAICSNQEALFYYELKDLLKKEADEETPDYKLIRELTYILERLEVFL